MRLFVALNLPDKIKDKIKNKISANKFKFDKIRIIPIKNWHITLKFLGEVQDYKLKKLLEILSFIPYKFNKFKLKLLKLEFLNPRILSIKSNLPNELLEIVLYLEEEFYKSNISKKELRPFYPHITIARCKNLKKQEQDFVLKKIKDIPKLEFEVDSIDLMQSILKPKGAEYKIVQSYFFS